MIGCVHVFAVELDGRMFYPSQSNNMFIFPGVGLGVVLSKAKMVTEEMFVKAAEVVNSSLPSLCSSTTSNLGGDVRRRGVLPSTVTSSLVCDEYVFIRVCVRVCVCVFPHVQSLANMVPDEDIQQGIVYPRISNIHNVSMKIAVEVIRSALKDGLCRNEAEMQEYHDLESFVEDHIFEPQYEPIVVID